MKRHTRKFLGAVAVTAGLAGWAATAQAATIFSENFDPLTPGRAVQDGYNFGDTTAHSSGVVLGVGVGGTAAWQTLNTAASGANGYSGVGGQYQHTAVSGNTSLIKGDYTLSFDARATGGNLHIDLQSWDGAGFGGSFNGSIGADVVLNSAYTHYDLNLGSFSGTLTGLGLTGGTFQLQMQFNGGGPTPYSYTMDVDNLTLTMVAVPEPSSLALCALGAAGGLAAFRRRKP